MVVIAGGTLGRLLMSFAPAGQMEASFAELERVAGPGRHLTAIANGVALMHAYGMDRLGPPLTLD